MNNLTQLELEVLTAVLVKDLFENHEREIIERVGIGRVLRFVDMAGDTELSTINQMSREEQQDVVVSMLRKLLDSLNIA